VPCIFLNTYKILMLKVQLNFISVNIQYYTQLTIYKSAQYSWRCICS